jgi:hypothetical protein
MPLQRVSGQIELRQRHAALNPALQLEELEVHVNRSRQLWMLPSDRLKLQRFS